MVELQVLNGSKVICIKEGAKLSSLTKKISKTSEGYFMTTLHVQYLRNAEEIYGEQGLHRATECSAGMDLRACFDYDEVEIKAGERLCIPCGVAIELLAENIAGFVYSRSGLGAKKGLTVAQGVGVIDPDYRGEIMVFLLNTSAESHIITRGERIAQIVFQAFIAPKICAVKDLSVTNRGAGGFGHSGKE